MVADWKAARSCMFTPGPFRLGIHRNNLEQKGKQRSYLNSSIVVEYDDLPESAAMVERRDQLQRSIFVHNDWGSAPRPKPDRRRKPRR